MTKLRTKALILTICITMSTLFGGCSLSYPNGGNKEQDSFVGLAVQLGVDFDVEQTYNIPATEPNILLDRRGYGIADQKQAIFLGDELADTFRVVNANTQEIIYAGRVEKKGYDRATDCYISYGDFSALNAEGVYYIECDVIGRSYDFVIEKATYDTQCEEAMEYLQQERDGKPPREICEAFSLMMLSYELFPKVYSEMPEFLEKAATWAAYLAGLQDDEGKIVDGETTAWFAATMAKFSYSYQNFDNAYATACLQAANKAWNYVGKHSEEVTDSTRFYAATELYRATGQYSYHSIVIAVSSTLIADIYDHAYVLGGLTYSATKRRVTVSLCSDMIQTLMDQAEAIAESNRRSLYQIADTSNTTSDLLWKMVILSAVDYIITNHEYATMIEDYVHYINGRNIKATPQEVSGLSDMAGYFFALSEIRSHRQE